MNISRKRIKKKKVSKNATPESLAAFKSEWIRVNEDGQDIIFQDESHFSNNILPLYGYSKRNTPCYINEPCERSAHTLNLAFSKSGQIFWKVYSGSANTSRMQWFTDNLPPIRVLMDNHSIHKAVKMTVEKIFTPVAQPEANPVEIVFSKVKTNFRAINELNRSLDVETKIEMALATLVYDDLINAIAFVDRFVRSTY
jgi:transposase